MNIEFTTKSGLKIGVDDLAESHEYYEAACTADFIQFNYPELKLSDEEALSIGYEVREQMLIYDNDDREGMAIDYVLSKSY